MTMNFASAASFLAHLLSIADRNHIGEKKIKSLFNLIVSNGGWEKSITRGKRLDFLKLANETLHAVTGLMNK